MGINEVYQLLKDNSTDKYFIEYDGFYANHLAHGVIALYRLGVSPQRTQQWIDWSSKKLESAEDHQDPMDDDSSDVAKFLGQRTRYYTVLQHYKSLYEKASNRSFDDFVSTHFRRLYDGMFASLLHGLIHMGYGYSVGDTQTVLEGIAYLHHSYVPLNARDAAVEFLHQNWGQGSHSPLEVLDMVNKDPAIVTIVNSKEYRELTEKVFQERCVLMMQKAGKELLSYTYKLKLPEWYKPEQLDMEQIIKLNNWIIDIAITVYASSEPRNDFMLLHGVTGAWSLSQLIHLMKDPQEASKALQLYLALVFAVYVADNTPPLVVPESVKETSEVTQSTWDEIIRESTVEDMDEHVYKLMQVCYDRWKETKDVAASSAHLYVTAARQSVRYPLAFPKYPMQNTRG